MHQPHALKCRPNTFSEVIWQSHVVQSLANAIRMEQIPHCILLTGTRGVGKTTIGRIFAKCLNCLASESPTPEPCQRCEHCEEMQTGRFPDFYEIDAASHTKVDQVRELQDTLPYVPTKGRFKVYLIDEVHMLSKSSFNALLKTLEEPPPHVIFILATTDPQKLPATILSRCLQFHLQAMPKEAIADHLESVLNNEDIKHDNEALTHIAQAARGSMRDAFSLLDQCLALGNGEIRTETVNTMLGTIDKEPLLRLLQALSQQDSAGLFTELNHLRQSGACLASALTELARLLQQVARIQLVDEHSAQADNAALNALASELDNELVQLLYQITIHGQRDLAYSPSIDCGVEMTLLRMLAFTSEPKHHPSSQSPLSTHTKTPASITQEKTAATQARVTPSAAPPHKPVTASSQAKHTHTNPSDLDTFWADLIPTLQVRGLAMALAKGCTLTAKTDSHWHLSISSKQKPMLQPRTEKALADALLAHYGSPIQLSITLSDESAAKENTSNTMHQSVEKKKPSNTALTAPNTDNPKLNKIIDAFSATIVDSTVVR